MTREEIALAIEHLDATEALVAAKEAYRAVPSAANKAARAAAIAKVRDLTMYWRGIREYLRPVAADGDGVAVVEMVKATSNVKKV